MREYLSGTQRGDAFWIGRGELLYEGLRRFQPSLFIDQGWRVRAVTGSRQRHSFARRAQASPYLGDCSGSMQRGRSTPEENGA